MIRLTVILFVLALAACSGSDTGQTPSAGETPPVDAAGAGAPEVPDAARFSELAVQTDLEVQSCLDLIAASDFQQALSACLTALELDPTNQQVSNALEQARAETTNLAVDAAAADAAERAGSQLGEAAEGLPGNLGE